jgi:hypothetical protein
MEHLPDYRGMATFDIDSFDEVEASAGDEHGDDAGSSGSDGGPNHTETEAAALAEAEEAMAKSEVREQSKWGQRPEASWRHTKADHAN